MSGRVNIHNTIIWDTEKPHAYLITNNSVHIVSERVWAIFLYGVNDYLEIVF